MIKDFTYLGQNPMRVVGMILLLFELLRKWLVGSLGEKSKWVDPSWLVYYIWLDKSIVVRHYNITLSLCEIALLFMQVLTHWL